MGTTFLRRNESVEQPVLGSQMKTKKRKPFGEEFHDSGRKDNILGRKKSRLELWEEHFKDPIVALDKALKCVESSC